uniref:BTB domain-containing protein n=1 Tax=Panagrellus redivivus TaxID=6233 RepID=A0A7E4V368_PANRE
MLPSYQPKVAKSFSSTVCVNIPFVDGKFNRDDITEVRTAANASLFQVDWRLRYKFDANGLGLYILPITSEKTLSVTLCVSIEDTSIEKNFTHIAVPNSSYDYIGHMFNNDESPQQDIKLRCHIVFQVVTANTIAAGPLSLNVFEYFGDCQNKNTDAEIHVADKVIYIHRGYFCMISPVFHAMFNHDTEEKRTGIIRIKDMDFTTIQNAVNFCYGQPLKDATTSDVVNVQTFGDKYDIKMIAKVVGEWILAAVNPFNFCVIYNYAWASPNGTLKAKCEKYYFDNVAIIALTPEFCELEKKVQRTLIQSCRSFKK